MAGENGPLKDRNGFVRDEILGGKDNDLGVSYSKVS